MDLILPFNESNYGTWKIQCQMEQIKDRLCSIVSLTDAEAHANKYRKFVAHRGSSCDYCAIDEDGILHIRSRLKNADLSDQVKHPKILPRGSHVTKLIIKLPGLVIKPDVPEDRLESAPPFYLLCSCLFWSTHHEGKTWGEIKRYVVIFMSMASRAIHLEIANSLDADSFLNSFRRFTIRRRPVRQLQSDQGANFARG